jgi:hypothetical protein
LFPTVIEITDSAVVRRKRSWFSVNESSIHLSRVASVAIRTGPLFSDIRIESSGGGEDIVSHGHVKAEARRIKELIDTWQTQHLGAKAPNSVPRSP